MVTVAVYRHHAVEAVDDPVFGDPHILVFLPFDLVITVSIPSTRRNELNHN